MKIYAALIILLLSVHVYGKCPIGAYSTENNEPFYSYIAKNKKLIFCGYAGKEIDNEIHTSEYDIFVIDTQDLQDIPKPILSFGAVDETIIYKSTSELTIKDIWGGFTYTLNPNSLKFSKVFTYKPSAISITEYHALSKKIKNGEMDYMWPWQVLDAAMLDYAGAVKLFLNLPNLDGAAAEEYHKAVEVYEAYTKNNDI